MDKYLTELKKKLLLWGALTCTDAIEEETIETVKKTGETMIEMDAALNVSISEYRKFA